MMVDLYLPIVVSLAVLYTPPANTYNNSAEVEYVGLQNSSAMVFDVQAYTRKVLNLEKLDRIGKLESGWNEYGAPPIKKKLINQAKRIVARLTKQPEIFPTGRGTVQMEYHQPDGTYLEFELFTDKITVLYVDKGNIENAEEDEFSLKDYVGVFRYIGRLN